MPEQYVAKDSLQVQPDPHGRGPVAGEVVPPLGTDIRRTFRLFWPIFLGQLASSSMGVVDTVMAGAAGTIELSGVAIGASFYWPCVLFVMGMTLAIPPTIAHLRGAGRSSEVAAKVHLATVICLVTSVVVGILMTMLPLFYKLIPDVDQDMVRVGQGYLIAVALGMPGFAMFNILRGYWEGLGNTLPTSVFGFIALFLNIPLNYIFIFGKLGMPALGGIGCGVATTITIYITVILMFIYVQKSRFYEHYRIYRHNYKISWVEVKSFLRFALPLALSTTIEVTCFSLVAVLLSPFGPITVAAHTIAMNISGVIFMIPLSIASATTIRVGEAMGAMHWCRALRTTLGAYTMGLVCYVLCFTGLYFLHADIIGLYTSDGAVQTLAVVLVMFCVAYLFPDSLQMICIGVLRGFKDSKTIFIVTVISYWVIGMPIGYSLAYGLVGDHKMGAQGFWIGFICALSCASILYVLRIIFLYRSRKLPKTFNVVSSEDVIAAEIEKAKEQERLEAQQEQQSKQAQ